MTRVILHRQAEDINWKRRFSATYQVPTSLNKETKPDPVTLRLNTPRYELKKADWQVCYV